MPTYVLQHLTRYTYEEPVSVCHHLAHLLPREMPHQIWRGADVTITPSPAVRTERLDYFGNRLTFFAIQEPHRELAVFSHARVELHHAPATVASAPTLFSGTAWEQVRDQITDFQPERPISAGVLHASQFAARSPYVQWDDELVSYAAQSFTPQRPLIEAVLDLMGRIHRDFKYDTKSTNVSTTLPEIMAARAGVCQDFAHLLIGAVRSHGLPARYMSGYLLTTPPPGKPRLVGADASHAWASIFLPGIDGRSIDSATNPWAGPAGSGGAMGGSGIWVDLDPTNNVIPSDKHITIAWGRDFGDVSPIRGVILGGGRHRIQVNVNVAPA